MKCPFCNHNGSKVVDSRPVNDQTMIRRRRECEKCKKRFTTYERIEKIPLMVVKRNGQRESYDQNKIYSGILKACEKRPISVEQIEAMVDQIEKQLYQLEYKEISSVYIGERVMEALKPVDEVAYVRFASVYRRFKDAGAFIEELNKLIKE